MARVVLLLLICCNPAIAQDEWIVVRCFGDVVQFSVKAFPNGIPMSDRAICKCLAKRWRGAECEMGKKQKEWHEWANRKNLEIMESIQPGSIRVGKGESR